MEDNDTSLGADDHKFDDPTNGDSKVAHRAESTARKTASMTSRAYGQMKKDIISGRLRPGQKLKIDAKTVAVTFRAGPGGFESGQKIFVASEDAAAALKARMAEYFLQGADLPLAEYHGGLPEMRNHTVMDPCSGGAVSVDLHTPRVQFRHGQNLYAADYRCINTFWIAMTHSGVPKAGTRTERGFFLA